MSFPRAIIMRSLRQARLGRFAKNAIIFSGTTSLVYGICSTINNPLQKFKPTFPLVVSCAPKFTPQSSVINGGKEHSLFLTIHLNPGASVSDCLKAVGQIKKHVDVICPPDLRDESDEIWYGIGFGHQFWEQIKRAHKPVETQPFPYRSRSGATGDLPSTGGDIFIHAKCNQRGKLYELCQAMVNHMPEGAVASFEDIYGWTYRGGRDLTGFIDGTENPADEDDRIAAAIDPKTGGSYVVTQKWIHKHDVINSTKDEQKEKWVGRTKEDSTELKKKPVTSHVARMVGSADFDAPAKYQIVRHSQPWGTVSGNSGLFFIAYSTSPTVLDWMLDRMTGDTEDRNSDDIMRMTRCVSGTYWFFPSQPEFERIVGVGGDGFRLWR